MQLDIKSSKVLKDENGSPSAQFEVEISEPDSALKKEYRNKTFLKK